MAADRPRGLPALNHRPLVVNTGGLIRQAATSMAPVRPPVLVLLHCRRPLEIARLVVAVVVGPVYGVPRPGPGPSSASTYLMKASGLSRQPGYIEMPRPP